MAHLSTMAEAAASAVRAWFPTGVRAGPARVVNRFARPTAAEALTAWNAFCADRLESFVSEIADANPSPLILWPEHFDQAFYTEDSDESGRANYGASPGDDGHPEPYLYVGPWGTPATDEFWNAQHFKGAVMPISTLTAAADPATMARSSPTGASATLVNRCGREQKQTNRCRASGVRAIVRAVKSPRCVTKLHTRASEACGRACATRAPTSSERRHGCHRRQAYPPRLLARPGRARRCRIEGGPATRVGRRR